jgi:hypothetical protein
VDETQGGPLVDFVAAVAAHIRDGLHAVKPDPERDAGMTNRLTALTRPRSITWRIHQASTMGLA